jgi:hypothetical protein
VIVGLHSHAMERKRRDADPRGRKKSQTRQSKGVRGKCGDVGGVVAGEIDGSFGVYTDM